MALTEDQILALAPDEASKKSGKDLANPSKWVSKGSNEKALWGEVQGSGSKPYQTQVDLLNIAFKCSCPSRKFPCKHGLGLLLFHARQPGAFTETNAPAWVTDWLNKRTEKEEKKAIQEEKPVDAAAQAKRQKARQSKVEDGIEELRTWIKDIVRNGIISMPDKGSGWFENMAKRMVDAQAPGLANMVRTLGETNFYAEGWQSVFMNQLLSIYLVVEGYKNTAGNELLHQDIKNWIGFTQSQDELKETKGVTDTWLVLSKQSTETDNITTEKNWLYGTGTNQYAMVLQFLVRGQAAQFTLTPGMHLQAELVFFSAAIPLRALIKKQISSPTAGGFTGFGNWQQVAETETENCSITPLWPERPYIILQLKPVKYNEQWWLQDDAKNMMQLKNEQKYLWKLLSLSGGNPLDMAVIGKEGHYYPVGVWHNDEYKTL
ncbi:MAG: SWIM zinc finger family protein [Ferruginibacter sp.]